MPSKTSMGSDEGLSALSSGIELVRADEAAALLKTWRGVGPSMISD